MIDFGNASLLALNQTSQFLGNDLARYRVVKNLEVRGLILDLANQNGVVGVLTGIDYLVASANDYQPIILKSINLGSGRITSINFAESSDNWCQTSEYSVSLEIVGTGNLGSNLVGGYYSGLAFTNYERIVDISENLSYNRNDSQNGYSRSINLQLISGAGNPITLAKAIATNLFNNTNVTGLIGDFGALPYRKFYTENYNEATNTCSWTENCEFANASGNYSLELTHSIQTDTDGISNITENGIIKGLVNPLYQSAEAGFNTQKPLIFPRVSGIFDIYVSDGDPLFTQPLNKQVNLNKFGGNVEYTYEYTNDPKYTGQYRWEFEHILDYDSNTYNVSERGSVVGLGRKGIDKYDKAASGFLVIEPGIGERISGFYQTQTTLTNNLFKVENSVSRSQFDGQIQYSQLYSDEASLLTGEIKKVDIQVSDQLPVYLTNAFNIVGQKTVIQPSQGLATVAKRDISLNSIGARTTTLDTFISDAKTRLAAYTGFASDSFIENTQYNLNRNKNEFNMTISIVGTNEPVPSDFGDLNI